MIAMAKKQKRNSSSEPDFGVEADVAQVMAQELDCDPEDLELNDNGRGCFNSFGVGVFWYVELGKKGYVVAESHDAMRELALAVVEQDLNDEPESFNQVFIESHINIEKLRRDLESEENSANYDYFNDMDDDDLIAEAKRWPVRESDYIDEDEDGEEILSDRDGLIEALAEERTEQDLMDPVAYLQEMLGEQDGIKRAIEIAGIDVDAAAEDAVDTDGPEHFVAHYDGNSYELSNGWVYWRTD